MFESTMLTSVTIPSTVTAIGIQAFLSLTKLSCVYWVGTVITSPTDIFLGSTGGVCTFSPSVPPSITPSVIPSIKPTRTPTLIPTGPSFTPTINPSRFPTSTPSNYPSNQPKSHPTIQPFRNPSKQPTCQPIYFPSSQPQKQPSIQPSFQPNKQPTNQPSIHPFVYPSLIPIRQPSSQPTNNPSSLPSLQPLNYPTRQPSRIPIIEPSNQPMSKPSTKPSIQPNMRPSLQPTSQPLHIPTTQPFFHPSFQPSTQPFFNPTLVPTRRPSIQPSQFPSSQPSFQPIKFPTCQPSRLPTKQPSSQPRTTPSSQPSSAPTYQPKSHPSKQPNTIPTSKPSLQPTIQPTKHPSSQPSTQPSRYPSSQPSRFPTIKPSNQPIKAPSSQPYKTPSMQPTFQPIKTPSSNPSFYPSSQPVLQPTLQPLRYPSKQPSQQPTYLPSLNPSGHPSKQPSQQPSLIPSLCPSYHPTIQPSTQPSSQPSVQPTINGSDCRRNSYYRFELNKCIDCPIFSYTAHIGALTCKCKDGFSQSGFGVSLNCYSCAPGYFAYNSPSNCSMCPGGRYSSRISSSNCTVSPPGTYSLSGMSMFSICKSGTFSMQSNQTSCDSCLPGTFSDKEGSTGCILCPQGFYSSDRQQSTCTQCQNGATTATVGSTSSAQCVVLIPNFTFGTVALVIVIILFGYYVFYGYFHRESFKRKEKLVIPVASACLAIDDKITTEKELFDGGKKSKNRLYPFIKLFIFLVFSAFCCFVIVFVTCVLILGKVFFNSFLIWRGLNLYIKFPPFVETITVYLHLIANYLRLPFPLLYYLAYPVLFFYEQLANLNLNLAAINVTCEGSKGPLQLLINVLILGLVIVFITADYQILWTITYPSVNQSYLFYHKGENLSAKFFQFSLYLCLLMILINSFNPFQAFLRFLMSFVTLGAFIAKDHSAHEITKSCDNISGVIGFDSFLGYSSTILAWFFIMPSVYTLADVLVPRKVIKNELNKINEVNNILKEDRENVSKKEESNNVIIDIKEQLPKQISNLKLIKAVMMHILRYLSLVISFDVWLTKVNEIWIRMLSGILKTNNNFNVRYPGLFMSIKSDGNRHFSRRNTFQYLNQSVQNFLKKQLSRPSIVNVVSQKFKQSSKRITDTMVKYEEQNVLSSKVLDEVWRNSEKVNLPIYSNLCKQVQQEIFNSIYKYIPIRIVCLIFSYFFAYIGIGHFFTLTGLRCWRKVLWKYFLFLQVCFGIWTDESAEEYGLETVCNTMCFKNDEFAMSNVIKGIVGPRAILFQIFPILTIMSVSIIITCGSPLFVFGKKIKENLPKLIILNPFQKALKREIEFVEEKKEKEKVNNWVV